MAALFAIELYKKTEQPSLRKQIESNNTNISKIKLKIKDVIFA